MNAGRADRGARRRNPPWRNHRRLALRYVSSALSAPEREPLLDETTIDDAPPPWTAPPSDLGFEECAWCHRAIYRPALPCSVRPVGGLASMATVPGQGKRCQWELLTRTDCTHPRAAPERSANAQQGHGA